MKTIIASWSKLRWSSLANVLWVAAPKALGGAAMLALNIGLLKWLTPDAYGIYSVGLTTLVLLCEGLFGSAIDLAVLRSASLYLQQGADASARQIETCGLVSKLAILSILALLLLPLAGVAYFVDLPKDWRSLINLAPLIWFDAVLMLTFSSVLLHLQLRHRFFRYGMLDLSHLTLRFGGVALMLVFLTASSLVVLPGYVLAWFGLAPAIVLAIYGARVRPSLSTPRLGTVEHRLELWHQAKWIFLTQLVSAVANKLDIMSMTALTDMDEVGIFMGGQTIASVPILAGSYLAIVLNPQVMPRYRAGTLFRFLRDLQLLLLAAALIGYGLFLANFGLVKDLLLPASFRASADVISVLMPMMLLAMTSYPLVLGCLLFLSPRSLIWMECLLLPVTLLAYVVLVPSYGAWGAAIVTAVMGIVKTVIAQWIALRLAYRQSAGQSEMGPAA